MPDNNDQPQESGNTSEKSSHEGEISDSRYAAPRMYVKRTMYILYDLNTQFNAHASANSHETALVRTYYVEQAAMRLAGRKTRMPFSRYIDMNCVASCSRF